MKLPLKDHTTLVRDQTAALQGTARRKVDVSVGSILRALLEASAAVVGWLQNLILKLLNTTRASTSIGADLDSWMADYGLSRLPALKATGIATFSRFTPSQDAVVPVGATLKTEDESQPFGVAEDTGHRVRPTNSICFEGLK